MSKVNPPWYDVPPRVRVSHVGNMVFFKMDVNQFHVLTGLRPKSDWVGLGYYNGDSYTPTSASILLGMWTKAIPNAFYGTHVHAIHP